jgi:hypothetical protein
MSAELECDGHGGVLTPWCQWYSSMVGIEVGYNGEGGLFFDVG